MENLIRKLESYLLEILDCKVSITPWEGVSRLPYLLEGRYTFLATHIHDLPCLLMVEKKVAKTGPAKIRKHLDLAQTKWHGAVVYVCEGISAYIRKRLIEHRVPFIVPGNQMYLPTLGVDLREHFRPPRRETGFFRPATQAALIHMLQYGGGKASLAELTRLLGYTNMTMSRAFDEILASGLGEETRKGRERRIHLVASTPDAWNLAQPLLRSPIKCTYEMTLINKTQHPGKTAGLSALAHYSLLAEPSHPVIALDKVEFQGQLDSGNAMAVGLGDRITTLEVWAYSPSVITNNDLVDPLSLYLSLRKTKDERVESALEQMIGGLPW